MDEERPTNNDRMDDEYHLDGNALGGLLADIFGRDVTAGDAVCGRCGNHNPVGALLAYCRGPGSVVRCPGCGSVLFVAVHNRNGYRLTFDRLRSLDISET